MCARDSLEYQVAHFYAASAELRTKRATSLGRQSLEVRNHRETAPA
jgi:hypothetical protein